MPELSPPEATSLAGAETLTDLELSLEWLSLMKAVRVSRNVHDRAQDFRELGAACLIMARRLEQQEDR